MNDTTPQKDLAGEWGLDEVFDLEALASATLHDEPYQYLVVPEFIRPAVYPTIHNDFPMVADRGPFDPREHPGGPAFARMIEMLASSEMTAQLAHHFGNDIRDAPIILKARRCDDPRDGGIHTDARTKLVSVLIYLNASWSDQAGCLRVLRSGRDIDDYAAEVVPVRGTLVAFRRTDYSFHGYRPTPGERRMLQMNYVTPKKAERATFDKHRSYTATHRSKRWLKRLARQLR